MGIEDKYIQTKNKITYFDEDLIQEISLPKKFTYPFYYTPHPLVKLATEDLQNYLENDFKVNHNFGLYGENTENAIGKMFGVLVVQDKNGKVGYLSAFSGKVADSNHHEKFVPPVFDMLTEGGFFNEGVKPINDINKKIKELEKNEHYQYLKIKLKKVFEQSEKSIADFRQIMRENKAQRRKIRKEKKLNLNKNEYELVEADLIKQSHRDQYMLRVLTEEWNQKLEKYQIEIDVFENELEALKTERKERSSALQNRLFESYSFLNVKREKKHLRDIFEETIFERPPAGAGECSTPKLLQYAFLNQLKPLAFAEFWWGASPKSEIRKHKYFYPACSGKCRPILKHMLDGIQIEENPLLINLAKEKQLKIVYEDEELVVVNKPTELLSVPGIEIQDSVYTRLQDMLKGVEPLIIHRLDMSTSGLLVVAKTKETHKHIQRQFLKKTVNKRYTALLSGTIEKDEGVIELPLRLDPLDRPRQIVCFDKGKKSRTLWKVIERNNETTKVHFWPITGRTHQLRVHSAHELGLNAPIVGDDLYGIVKDRLYLHAGLLEFQHPKTKENLCFEIEADF